MHHPSPKCEHLIIDMGVALDPPVNKRGLGTRPLLNMCGDVVNSIRTQPFYLLYSGGVTSRSLKIGGGGGYSPPDSLPPPQMCNLLAHYLLRYWGFKTQICNVQSLSMLSPKRLGIRMANVQSLSTRSPKRLGIRDPNVQCAFS